jgi:hypothetical protein
MKILMISGYKGFFWIFWILNGVGYLAMDRGKRLEFSFDTPKSSTHYKNEPFSKAKRGEQKEHNHAVATPFNGSNLSGAFFFKELVTYLGRIFPAMPKPNAARLCILKPSSPSA